MCCLPLSAKRRKVYNDKQLVRITMFVFLVGIVLVYAVFFNTKGESLAQGATSALEYLSSLATETGSEEEKEPDIATYSALTGDETILTTGATETGTEEKSAENSGTTLVFSGLSQLFGDDTDVYLGTGVTMLSGTSLFQGSIDVLKTLGINYEYALKDNQYDIYYVYIGNNKNYNLREIAQEFGGKTIEIYSQKDIINNLYFGDRVTFIELPQYKDVKVNVFIQYGEALWMIQDDASQYKAHKKYIRKLFTGK